MVLKFLVKYQTLYLLSRDPVIADSSGYLQANFIFSDDWEGTNKTAQFKRTESTLITDGTPLFFNEEIDSNGNCLVPWEVLKGKGTFNVNVFGQKTESDGSTVKTITVNSLDIRVGESGLTTDEIPQDSTASQYDNIYEKILAAEKETQTSQAAAAASQAAAKTSETNAASSASAASTSASAAATSETNAATHETNAKTALASCQNIQSQIAGTYLPLSGGTMTDSIRYVDNGKVFTIGKTRTGNVDICWGWAKREGAGLALRSTDYPSPGEFMLFARDSANSCSLDGKPDGTLTWDNKEIERVSAKGTYGIRFESGIQICWGELSIPAGTAGREVSGTMTFPYPFANTNYVLTFGNDWLASSSEYYRAEGRNTGNFRFTAVGVNTNSHKAFYVAIGYWK